MKKTLIIASMLLFAGTMSAWAETEAVHPLPKNPVYVAPVPKCNCGNPDCTCNKGEKCNCKSPKCTCRKAPQKADFAKRQAEFENRLKLTDEQKAKAKEIRQKGMEEIKPVMEKMKEKRAEMDAVILSKIAPQAQKEKLDALNKDMAALKREAHELRMKNMKEFESILTAKQQKELKKMKDEGRKKFEKNHKKRSHLGGPEHRPGFGQGFGPGPVIPKQPVVQETK